MAVRGDWAQARQDGEQALTLTRSISGSWVDDFPLTVLGLVCYGEGQWEDATRYLEESQMVGKRLGHLPYVRLAPSVLAEIDLRQGHPARARARLAPLPDKADLAEVDLSLLLPPCAWACLELGDVVTAADLAAQAITQARAQNDQLVLVDALRVQAMVAIRQSQWDAAGAALDAGLALARGMPYPYAEARLLHVYGQMHVQQQEHARARECLEAALAIFGRLGARKDTALAEHALSTVLDSLSQTR
jgi:tetratricopeptide (TPR) repeat protein